MAPRSSPLFLLFTLAVPATALFISTYLYNAPLSARKTRTIRTSESLSPQAAASHTLHHVVNPRGHIFTTDLRRIILSKTEIGNLTDEEILARFLRGFYNGWVFLPEKGIISIFRAFGRSMIPVGFTDILTNGPQINSPASISRTTLPEKFTMMLSGNFMVLDKHVNPPSSSIEEVTPPSYIEIGFGDNRKQFAGVHHFQVSRDVSSKEQGEKGAVELWYSSVSCNPTVDKMPFPKWIFGFHNFYAQCLFRDGVREVLSR